MQPKNRVIMINFTLRNHIFFVLQFQLAVFVFFNAFKHIHGNGDDCSQRLGMETGTISDAQITASSEKNSNHRASNARLYLRAIFFGRQGGWNPATINDQQWLQVDFLQLMEVTGIETQGRQGCCFLGFCCDQWVTSYTVSYSKDSSTYELYKDRNNQFKVFHGNQDADTVVYQRVSPPIVARHIRIHPITWNRDISMRIEFLGCSPAAESEINEVTKTSTTAWKSSDTDVVVTSVSIHSKISTRTISTPSHISSANAITTAAATSVTLIPTSPSILSSALVIMNVVTTVISSAGGPNFVISSLTVSSRISTMPTYTFSRGSANDSDNAIVVTSRFVTTFAYGATSTHAMKIPITATIATSTTSKSISTINATTSPIATNTTTTTTNNISKNTNTTSATVYVALSSAILPSTASITVTVTVTRTTGKKKATTATYTDIDDDGNNTTSTTATTSLDSVTPLTTYVNSNVTSNVTAFKGDPISHKSSLGTSTIVAIRKMFTIGTQTFNNTKKSERTIASTSTVVTAQTSIPSMEASSSNEWTAWTQCSETCSGGRQQRMRGCVVNNSIIDTSNCSHTEARECNTQRCPVDGSWTQWTAWPECNRPCGVGNERRTRSCTNPAPAHGGNYCEGEDEQSRDCNTNICPAVTAMYTVRLLAETWSDDLTTHGIARTMIEKKIEYNLRNSHHTVMTVELIELRKGSVIATFNVTYQTLDSIQILVVQEHLADKRLGDMSAELLNIITDNVPNEVPNITEAFASSSTSIYITWSVISDTNGAPLLGYSVFYRQINVEYQPDIVKTVRSDVTETRLEHLKKFTHYVMRVLAFTKNGNGVSGERVIVRTDEDVPSEPPPHVEVFVHNPTTITVIWDRIDKTVVHGILLGYNVTYGRHSIRGGDLVWKSKILSARETSLVLNSLQKFTYYSILICAFTSKGCGVKSKEIKIRTREDVPSMPPQDVKVLDLFSLNSVQVNWYQVPAGHVNGDLQGYKLTYQLMKASDQHVRDVKETMLTFGPQDLSVLIHDLRSFSVYKIRVAAFTRRGTGPYSEDVTAETCRCPEHLYTNYWALPPYVRTREDGTVGGIFPKLLEDMVRVACGNCSNGHGETSVNMTSNGQADKAAFKPSLNHVLQEIDEVPEIHFPIYGNKYVTKYLATYTYVYLVESPGAVFITISDPPSTNGMLLFRAALVGLPLITLVICVTFIAGFVFWMLEFKSNANEVQPSFLRGFGDGIWWSFVSMTTVGYGDKSPSTVVGRLFCIAWILIGVVIISIVTSSISSELTNVTLGKDIIIYGSKIAAIQNSTEHRLGILMNAVVNKDRQYRSIEEIRLGLQTREVQGALLDTYVAAEYQEELFTEGVRVSKVLDKAFGYGIVLSGAAANVKKGFDEYIKNNINQIFRIIEKDTRKISVPEKSIAEEASAGLFDSSSSAYQWTVRVVGGMLVLATLLGLVWHYGIFRLGKRRNKNGVTESQYKTMLMKEMNPMVDEFYRRTQETMKKLAHGHRKQLQQMIKRYKNLNQSSCLSPQVRTSEDIELTTLPANSSSASLDLTCGTNRVSPGPAPCV